MTFPQRWIPKVIIGEFVKHCPGCGMKRATVKSEGSKMSLYGLSTMESMEDDDGDWDGKRAIKSTGNNDDDDDDDAMDEDD
jgi:hypothetical protein